MAMPVLAGRAALDIIHDEHATLAAILRSLQLMLQLGPADEPKRFFDVVRTMLFYIDEFPEREHHPKESELLFPMLAEAAPALRPVLEALDGEHGSGLSQVRELQHRLAAWELLGDSRRPAFVEAADRYVAFYQQHMRVEETQVLPEARRLLSPAQRATLDAAFQANRDPLDGVEPDGVFERLFTRIVTEAPAPIGVGPASNDDGARWRHRV